MPRPTLETDLREFLSPLTDIETERISRRRVSTFARARIEDTAMVGYTTMDSPFGELLIAESQFGIVRVAFENEDFDAVVAEIAARVTPSVVKTRQMMQIVVNHFDAYFNGYIDEFFVDPDLSLTHGFRRHVLDALQEIPYGETRSYREVANAVGNPKAVRAVGSACASNPVPFVVPCHRVVKSDGRPGNYRGGADAKLRLLRLEGALPGSS